MLSVCGVSVLPFPGGSLVNQRVRAQLWCLFFDFLLMLFAFLLFVCSGVADGAAHLRQTDGTGIGGVTEMEELKEGGMDEGKHPAGSQSQ